MTRYEEEVLNVVLKSHDHPTAEDVFFKVKEIEPKISMATVYNNLKKLVDLNLIRRISIEGQPDFYDNMTPHSHLYCMKCHKIIDVMFDDLTDELRKRSGVENIDSYELRLNYVCDDCLTKHK